MVITSIHLFSGNTSDAKRFEGSPVNNISFDTTQEDVQKVLGTPTRKGGGYKDVLGVVPKWDKYYFDFYTLHFQYAALTGKIDIMTIATMKLEPYFNSSLQ
jgi:hypothetical protein